MAGGEHGANGLQPQEQDHTGALEEGRGGANQPAGCEDSEQALSSTANQPMISVQFVQKSLVLEFIITFYLMFVISGVATDNRAVNIYPGNKGYFPSTQLIVSDHFLPLLQIGELAGLAVGATVLLNVLFAGPISGASMNPARTIGPAMVAGRYTGIWVYIVGPVSGAVAGAWAYNLIRFTNKPLREITRTGSFLRSARMS
ncbi:unnamed protein product [Triticum turgidum subsp. durum]|uniref:Uncharacterized protein n=1 Tax=Triticum turgidum subsp. durum TaxID=4567 RepID=A0A9R0WQY0_TRITD|nr:unnamed protein product [Triticum turgidum subsp. durum]